MRSSRLHWLFLAGCLAVEIASVPYTISGILDQSMSNLKHQSPPNSGDFAYLMIFQLRPLFFLGGSRGQEPCATLALQFHDNAIEIRTFGAFQNHSSADLVKVGKGNVTRLVEDD